MECDSREGPIEGAKFAYNDSVQITNGPHIGERGAIVSAIVAVGFGTTYIVELGSGAGDVTVVESHLASLE